MLEKICVENFYSIGASQTIEFTTTKKDEKVPSVVRFNDNYINLVTCFVGANASGKTSILKAITFIYWLLTDSYTSMSSDELLPIEPHKLREKQHTKIEVIFSSSANHYKYTVELTRRQIVSEYLGKKITRGFSRIFEYKRKNDDWDFKSDLDINKRDLERFKARDNISVISSLIETGYLNEIDFLKRCSTNVTTFGRTFEHPIITVMKASKKLQDNTNTRNQATKFLLNADLGISNFEFLEPKGKSRSLKAEKDVDDKTLHCVHQTSNGDFKLRLLEESNGTQHGLWLLTEILPIIEDGGIAIIDEIESGLHPYVAKKLISMFEEPNTNPKQSQLVFSTHQPSLLNDRSKSQIFLCEKARTNLETEIFRLDEVEGVRNDENFGAKYLAGEYGGIPKVNWL